MAIDGRTKRPYHRANRGSNVRAVFPLMSRHFMTYFAGKRGACAAAILCILMTTVPAGATGADPSPAPMATATPAMSAPPMVSAPATATITGTVKTPGGAPLAGAKVTVIGPAAASTTTDAAGAFSLTLPAGIYRITVSKTGYESASSRDIALAPGLSVPLTVTVSEENLSSLRTIGSVATEGRSAIAINTGASTQSYIGGEVFTGLANPQINNVLQHIPDVVIEKLGTQADTSIVVGGLQPYETQVLIDGHPVALGQYGVYLSQFFPSYMVGGAETQSGPGNTTPFANLAVGGTVNLQTIGFTKKTTFEVTQGFDEYSSLNTSAIVTGSSGKFEYVAGAGFQSNNGYYFGKKACDVYETDPTTTVNSPNSAGIAAFCGDFSGSFFSRAQIEKLRYDFSPTTSFDIGFLGSYGGYSPQGSAWGASYGPTLIEGCIPGTLECTNPANANLIGKTINGFYWFPGTLIINQQQLYDAQFRTSLGATTLLVRPYIGTLEPETYDGTGEGAFPAFFGPNSSYPACANLTPTTTCYPGPQSLPPGTQIPVAGLPNPNAFENTSCPVGNIYSYNQINSPTNTIVSKNGQEECFQYPYSTYERDTLYGSTFSLERPIEGGNGFLDLTYDFHGSGTFAYANNPVNFQVPAGSATRFSTFSLTGKLAPTENLGIRFGLYNTDWTVVGEQPTFANGVVTGSTGLNRTIGHFDPHVALTYRYGEDTSLRAAFGTSTTFPFVGDVTGPAAVQPPAFLYTAGIITEKNPNLDPETSSAYDFGVDQRFPGSSLVSLDLQKTTVRNVFQQLTTQENTTLNGAPAILGIFTPINVARLDAYLLTFKFTHAPRTGFGYNASLTADRSQLSGIPEAAYNASPSLPANNVQVCGNGEFTPGLATCIPYLKGYGQLNYRSSRGTYAALGVDYEGANNAYYQPPFAILDLEARQPLTRYLDLNFSVENLLNTNSFDYLPAPNLGVPAIADVTNGKGIQQTSYSTYRIPAVTRTIRVSARIHLGR
jgi:outer membrane receptor protein involved in Fe transport